LAERHVTVGDVLGDPGRSVLVRFMLDQNVSEGLILAPVPHVAESRQGRLLDLGGAPDTGRQAWSGGFECPLRVSGAIIFIMSNFRLALVVLPMLASTAVADVFKGVRYSVPSGWVAADRDGVRTLAPTDKAGGELLVLVLGAEAASGTSDEQMEALETQLTKGVKVTFASKVLVTNRGDRGTFYMTTLGVNSAERGDHGRMISMLVRDDQHAVLLFVFSNQATWEKHAAGVQSLLNSVSIDVNSIRQPARSGVATPTPTPTPTPRPTSTPTATRSDHLPTGETPDNYPGSVGWLPSGRGAAIPAARLVNGRPQGLWWRYQVKSSTQMSPLPMVFLPDGTMAHLPRPGSGTQVDLEHQRRQHGSEYVGTFRVRDGQITTSMNGYTQTDTFTSGRDKGEEWFEIGAGRHYPLALGSAKGLVGRWKGEGQSYVFRADGTFQSGNITDNAEFTATQNGRGTWQLDGYLLGFTLADGSLYIDLAGMTSGFLVIGSVVYTRQ